jgi:hypothetical protein
MFRICTPSFFIVFVPLILSGFYFPPGTTAFPTLSYKVYCDNSVILNGTVGYFDNTVVSPISATTWNQEIIGDETVVVPGMWATYANQGLPAPLVNLNHIISPYLNIIGLILLLL